MLTKALNNAEAREEALKKITKLINATVLTEAVVTGQQVSDIIPAPQMSMSAQASELDNDVSEFVGNLPMSARMKILNSVDMT